MRLEINDSKKITDIQRDFNLHFPYLRMSFFSKPHSVGKGSSKKIMIDGSLTLKECRRKHNAGNIEIVASMSVSELESKLWSEFGLSVQVFRKSGTSWLETTATDGWSLEKQNQMGHDISDFNKREETEEFDNDKTK